MNRWLFNHRCHRNLRRRERTAPRTGLAKPGFLQSRTWPRVNLAIHSYCSRGRHRSVDCAGVALSVPGCPARNGRGRQTRFPFIYFRRHFIDCHRSSSVAFFPESFLHSNSRLYFNHQECSPSLAPAFLPGPGSNAR